MANTTIPSELIQADVALGGSPTTTTQSAGNNTTKLATTAFVTTAVNNLIASAPGTMDTLNEIAAALNDDPDFTTTVNNAIATKLPLAGGTMTGNIAHASDFTIDAGGNIILDADGGDIKFLDDGTETLRYSSSGSGPQFFSPVADKDIIFKGKDGSSTITALTLDMSNAGDALFNNRVFTSGGTGANTSVNADDLVLGLTNNSTERGITIASTAGGGIRWNDGADAGTLQYVHSTNQMQFYTAGALATVIDSSGNLLVGGTAAINSSSGRGNITISGSSNAILNFGVNNTQKGYIYHTSTDMRFANAVSGAMQFYTSDTERMRIDSAGRVGLGSQITSNQASTYDSRANDFVVSGGGDTGITIAGGSSEDIRISFTANGTTGLSKGSITYDNNADTLAIETGGTQRIRIDSDGLKFGSDTAAANALDDYEEGEYTVTLTPTSGSITINSGINTMKYTKVGRLVTITGRVNISSINSPTGGVSINLPFTSSNSNQSNSNYATFLVVTHDIDMSPNSKYIMAEVGDNSSTMLWREVMDSSQWPVYPATSLQGDGNEWFYLKGSFTTA